MRVPNRTSTVTICFRQKSSSCAAPQAAFFPLFNHRSTNITTLVIGDDLGLGYSVQRRGKCSAINTSPHKDTQEKMNRELEPMVKKILDLPPFFVKWPER